VVALSYSQRSRNVRACPIVPHAFVTLRDACPDTALLFVSAHMVRRVAPAVSPGRVHEGPRS